MFKDMGSMSRIQIYASTQIREFSWKKFIWNWLKRTPMGMIQVGERSEPEIFWNVLAEIFYE